MVFIKSPPNYTYLDKMHNICSSLCRNMKPEQRGNFILSCESMFLVEANNVCLRGTELGKS